MAVALVTPAEQNLWHKDATAKAFWDQHRALPYRELLQETIAWCDPKPNERWLDLGCGGGHLTAALWHASSGQVESIEAVDCAEANVAALDKVRQRAKPRPTPDQIRFSVGDFSIGLPQFPDDCFDGVVSGLAISYAESFDERSNQYTDEAYNWLLHELQRIIRPGGRLVFSVNVPNPNFWRIVWKSFGKGLKLGKPWRTVKNVWQMQRHGAWLKREAKRGRFHFFHEPEIVSRLHQAGFSKWQTKLSYADQAYLIRAEK
jgi:ubiquinone/menaquinone biosynthesis C-methylase UbiE